MKSSIQYGTTFSHLHAQWLGLDVRSTFKQTLSLKFDYIRLCCYWKECEPQRGMYVFSSLDELLTLCERKKQAVVVTVGMKAPRWPEFHLPDWTSFDDPDLHTHVLRFIKAVILHLRHYRCIHYWQVENEPIERMVTNFRAISMSLFSQEVSLVRSLDHRPIIGTMLANSRYLFFPERSLLGICDVLGVDLYFKIPVLGLLTLPFLEIPGSLRRLIMGSSKPVWITELQAEPWESHNPFTKQKRIVGITASGLRDSSDKARKMGATTIFFWGVEYWIAQQQRGDSSLLQTAKMIINQHR